MKITSMAPATLAALLSLSASAFAQAQAMATTDLNMRAGPGPQYPVVGVIPASQGVTIEGCIANSKWCSVSAGGEKGWAYSDYLTGEFGGTRVVLTERPADAGIAVVQAPEDTSAEGAVAGGTTGAVAGALIGGPVGAVVGGVAGATIGGAAGEAIEPPAQVRTYVTSNRVDPVYLDGEVVVGAGIPDTVQIREIPDYEYRYVYVNGQPVLVDPGTRRIVHVMR